MPCTSFTSARGLACTKTMGGIDTAYLIQYLPSASFTTSSIGLISGSFTNLGGNKFYEFELIQETSNFTFTPNANVQNQSLFYGETLTMVFTGYDAVLRNHITAMANNTIRAIVKTNDNKYFYLGDWSGLDVSAGEAGSGTAAGDRNGLSITFRGINITPPREVDPALINNTYITFA